MDGGGVPEHPVQAHHPRHPNEGYTCAPQGPQGRNNPLKLRNSETCNKKGKPPFHDHLEYLPIQNPLSGKGGGGAHVGLLTPSLFTSERLRPRLNVPSIFVWVAHFCSSSKRVCGWCHISMMWKCTDLPYWQVHTMPCPSLPPPPPPCTRNTST